MQTGEHTFLWEMREFGKPHAGKLISREFLGRTHSYKWRCTQGHVFYAIFWELKQQKSFCKKCKDT